MSVTILSFYELDLSQLLHNNLIAIIWADRDYFAWSLKS